MYLQIQIAQYLMATVSANSTQIRHMYKTAANYNGMQNYHMKFTKTVSVATHAGKHCNKIT